MPRKSEYKMYSKTVLSCLKSLVYAKKICLILYFAAGEKKSKLFWGIQTSKSPCKHKNMVIQNHAIRVVDKVGHDRQDQIIFTQKQVAKKQTQNKVKRRVPNIKMIQRENQCGDDDRVPAF